jgi:hypothetical protein
MRSAFVLQPAGSVSSRIVLAIRRSQPSEHPSIREMEETAWLLRSDARRNQIGFVQGFRLRDEERFVLEED